jgi:hypothetical protein
MKKMKKQFIPLPWNIGDFIFRNIYKLMSLSSTFNNVNIKYTKNIKGFDPNKIFVEQYAVSGIQQLVHSCYLE